MSRLLIVAALLLAIIPELEPSGFAATRKRDVSAGQQWRGLIFARQRCSSCHSVIENGVSPNPVAPSFPDIANRPGLTGMTLQQFLRNSHNYPAVMNFELSEQQVADLSKYISEMKRPDYRPVM